MKSLRNILYFAIITVIVMIASACSTKKNTPQTRFWESFTTRYNVYYNGKLAYIDASLEKENGNKDNYTERLPLYTVGNKTSRELGKGNYEKAIEKAKKAIKLHSITIKPKWTKARPKNEKEIEYYSRREYNPFLWKAWMLMGRSQFHEGAFDDAASTFAWMSRLYKTQPAIYGKARAWLAKCYIEQDWIYDAEDIIRNMQRDSIDWRAQKEWDYTLADYYLHTGELDKASTYLRKVIKHEIRSKQRAREYYILGQIEASLGNRQAAYKAFKKVVSQNPPYELEFNARIAMTEVLASGQAKQMISRLKRMARNDNNKEYLDQVYYAMGNIYLAQKDTLNAISAYEKGNEKATRSGIEKGVLLLHLGDLYWTIEKYGDAQRCYGEAIGLLDKERKDYKQLAERSKVLDQLVPYTDAIYLQDSLQVLAKMDEKDRNAAIDRVITALKKKEKEERDKQQEAESQRVQQLNGAKGNGKTNNTVAQRNQNNKQPAVFYFYNATTVQQGKQAFERQWGKRENADDWQRINKTVVAGINSNDNVSEDVNGNDSTATELANLTDEQRDSIAAAKTKTEETDSAANDPHKREYYLAQIPFSEEQISESNEIIKDGLYNSGVIFKDKLDNLMLSKKQFDRLTTEFPEFEHMDDVYYHQFLLFSRLGDSDRAEACVEKLKEQYPDSKWTKIVTDPYFEENALFGKHIEDSLYTATYDAFVNGRYDEVMANTELSDTRFILGDNRDKFLFISGLSLLNDGQPDSCLSRMEKVVKHHPQSSVATLAGMIINGVKEGKTLRGANFSMTDIWNRRTVALGDADSLESKKFSEERDIPFMFMFVYNPDSLDENQLLFQIAKFNFTTFVARNFELDFDHADGLQRMQVSGFRNFDEAKQYMHVLYSNSELIKELTRKARAIIISEENLPLLGTHFSYNDYDKFYVEHFQPLPVEREYMLYEPDAVKPSAAKKAEAEEAAPALPSEQAAPGGATPVTPKSSEEENEDGENPSGETFTIGEDSPVSTMEEITITDDNKDDRQNTSDGETIVVDDAKDSTVNSTEEITIIEDSKENGTSEEELFIMEDSNENGSTDEELIIVDESNENSNENDDSIIMDDEKSDTEEIEDEYYELDGF